MRKPKKSIIKAIAPIPDDINDHLYRLGFRSIRGQTKYTNTETKEEYYHIAGGIAWPGIESPGYVLIIGVTVEMENDREIPVLFCLEEAEDRCVDGLLGQCLNLRERYGYDQGLLGYWYGDYERLQSLVGRFNQGLPDETNHANGVYLSHPSDFEKSNHLEIYLDEIRSVLTPRESGAKSLFIGNCNRLQNALRSVLQNAAKRYSDDDCPPVACLGYVVHSLLASMPWRGSGHTPGIDISSWEEYALSEGAAWQANPFQQNLTDCT
jgi:hypothetical protein